MIAHLSHIGASMESNAFWTELDERVAKYDLLCHPYYKSWSAGSLTRADLCEYAANYYHHVAAFPTYLAAFYARLEDGAFRRTVLVNLADEEAIEGGRPHPKCGWTSPKVWRRSRCRARIPGDPRDSGLISRLPQRRSERLAGRSARSFYRRTSLRFHVSPKKKLADCKRCMAPIARPPATSRCTSPRTYITRTCGASSCQSVGSESRNGRCELCFGRSRR